MDVWELIQNDNFREACEEADLQYEKTGYGYILRNKIYALFHLRKFKNIIDLSTKIIQINTGNTDADFISLGIAYWAISDQKNAINAWNNAQCCMYKDAAGGIDVQVYLYFASLKTKDDKLKVNVLKNLKKILQSKMSINWPGPIGHFLLGELTNSELFSYITDVQILKDRQLCQAYFACAIKMLDLGELDAFYENLRYCTKLGSLAYLEYSYYLAMIELSV